MTSAPEHLVLSRVSRGRYVLEGTATPPELRMAGWRARGEAIIGQDSYQLQRSGFLARGVSAFGPDGDQVLRLARRDPFVPPLSDCTWRVRSRLRGYEATLHSAEIGSITFRVGYGGRSGVTVQVVGTWPQRDLILITGAFAILLRRREDSEAGAGVVASTAAIS